MNAKREMPVKFGPILRDIRERETGLGGGKNILRFNQGVLRKLVCQENTTYKKRWKFDKMKNRIYYESGKIYCENYTRCIITCGFQGDPRTVYKISSVDRAEMIRDCLFCHTPNLTEKCVKDDACRSSLLALTDCNRLLHLDSDTGKVLQKIYLSNRSRFRCSRYNAHISWETVGHFVVLKSISYCKRNASRRRAPTAPSETVKFAFMIFQVFPLRFRAHFEINDQVFPDDVRDAQVVDGLLMVDRQKGGGTVCVYSLKSIIENHYRSTLEREDEQSFNGGIFENNSCMTGLPVNVEIAELPPLLLTVKCANNDVAFDGYPWQYIIRVAGKMDTFQVCTLDSPHVAHTLQYETNRIEPEGVTFHDDNSGRIIHYSATEFRVLKLISTDDDIPKLETIYRISFEELLREPSKQRAFTSSGRRLTRNSRLDSANEAFKHSLISFHYEDELDLITMLIGEPSSSDSCEVHGYAHIYDNTTGALIKEIRLEHKWQEDDEHTIILDCDVLVHIINRPRSYNNCFMYKLTRTEERRQI